MEDVALPAQDSVERSSASLIERTVYKMGNTVMASLLCLSLLLTAQAGNASDGFKRDRALLTAGVSSITAPGALPGPMMASGNQTFVVLTGQTGGRRAPLFVAGRVDKGRVVAGGHESFFGASQLRNPSNAQFLTNALGWLAQRQVKGVKVGMLDLGGIDDVAAKAGAVPMPVQAGNLVEMLPSLDVICMTQGALDGNKKAQDEVMKFVKAGHGLLIAGPAWGWQMIHPDRDLREDHTGNRMLLSYGIGFSDGTLDGEFNTLSSEDLLLQVDSALEALKKGTLKPDETARATDAVQRSIGLVPVNGDLAKTINRLAAGEGTEGGPSPKKPITLKTPFSRLRTAVEQQQIERQKPEDTKAHPSAAGFPGAIPSEAKRVTRSVSIDANVPNWHGTGLYAAPGEVVTITIPDDATGAKLSVRVGSHTDGIWHLENWERFPTISRSWRLEQKVTKIASPFGGTIYIDVPNNSKLGTFNVTIEHAVPAPHYVRGKTTAAEWQAMIAEPGAPWVDLEGKLVILSVPRSACDWVKDPGPLMEYWDEMMTHCYTLYAEPKRSRPERYCVDHQISAGYMHSGYPIMTFEDVARTFCDVEKLRSKGGPTWGFYHEMGHNFQQGDWTFGGTGEVTNNLFSLYGAEKLNAVTPATYGLAHKAMETETAKKRLEKYLLNGAKFSEWTRDPFLALTMYAQLREGFGWEPFSKVFAEYRALPRGERPRSDEEKHDQWMVRFSRAVNKNLGPFFLAWGVPTSEAARKSIANLPEWMPADWPGRGTAANGAR